MASSTSTGDTPSARARHKLRAMAGLVASRGYVASAGFIGSVLWANTFSKDTYGKYQVIVAATAIAGSFCLTGLNDAALISASKNKDGNLATIIRWRLAAASVGALFVAAWGVVRFRSEPTMLLAVLAAAGLFVPIQLQPIWQAFTNGKRRFRMLTAGQMALATANLCGIAAFAAAGASSDTMLPWVILTSQGVLALVGILLQLELRSTRINDERDTTIVAYGHHVTAASLLAWVFSSDRLIVGELLTHADVAVLGIAIVLPAQVKVFFTAFEQVFLPDVTASTSVAAAWRYMRPRMVLLWVGYTALGVVGFLLLPHFIPLVFSERYVEAVPYARWLWLSTCLSSPFTFLASILNAQRDKRFLYLKNLASPAFTLTMFVVLIPSYGLDGAVAARVASAVLLVGLHVGYFVYALRKSAP